VQLSQGLTEIKVCRTLEFSEPAYSHMQAQKLKELERDIIRLQKLVADFGLDNRESSAVKKQPGQAVSGCRGPIPVLDTSE
jgi:hypothetical protein